MILPIGHMISVAFMDVFGLLVNSWFLYTIKNRATQLNAIDLLQVCKTTICLVALTLCVWMEFVPCSSKECTGAKVIADDLFHYSTCLSFLAIACIRHKACECRGHASVLVTQTYAIMTILVCFIPVGMFIVATLSLMANNELSIVDDDKNHTNENTDSNLLTGDTEVAYELCHLMVFTCIPLFISVVLYLKIYKIVVQTAKLVDDSITQRTHDPSKMITMSVALLLSMMLAVWGIYVIVKVISLFMQLADIMFLYWKLIILIIHPFGEGVLQKSGQKPKGTRRDILRERSTRQVHPWDGSPSMTDSNMEDGFETLSLDNKLSVLIEERIHQSGYLEDEHTKNGTTLGVDDDRRQSNAHPRSPVLIRNAAVIGLELQGSHNGVDINEQRKASEQQQRIERLSIEAAALPVLQARRLSNCLRFSTAQEPSDDEIYNMYRELYIRRESKISGKSRRFSRATSAVPEYRPLSYAHLNTMEDKDTSVTGSGHRISSQKRWKKLCTIARTAKMFTNMRTRQCPLVIEEEGTEAKEKKENDVEYWSRHDTAGKPIHKIRPLSLIKQRRSVDHCLSKNLETKSSVITGKKRSTSCICNTWMRSKRKRVDRTKSVSFISSAVLDGPATREDSAFSLPMSVSRDSKIYMEYRESDVSRKTNIRRSQGDVRKKTERKDYIDKMNWLLNDNTTREECIDKLVEMKEYF